MGGTLTIYELSPLCHVAESRCASGFLLPLLLPYHNAPRPAACRLPRRSATSESGENYILSPDLLKPDKLAAEPVDLLAVPQLLSQMPKKLRKRLEEKGQEPFPRRKRVRNLFRESAHCNTFSIKCLRTVNILRLQHVWSACNCLFGSMLRLA